MIFSEIEQHFVNLPNLLSLSRVAFLFVIALLLYWGFRGAATASLVLYILAAITDWADGWVARKYGMITDFGKLMDALADKVLNVGVFVVLYTVPGLMPGWTIFLILIILSREFLITGLRQVAATRGVVLAAEKSGKIKTVFQIVAASLFIANAAAVHDFAMATWFCDLLAGAAIILLLIATAMTVQSGYGYLSKYWHLLTGAPTEPKPPHR